MTSSEPPRSPAVRPEVSKGSQPASIPQPERGWFAKPKNIPSPSDAKASAYARFIPREEVTSFAAWSLGDIGDATAAPPHPLRRASDAAAARNGANGGSAADVAEQIAAQMRAARQSGYQDGYRDGLAALEGFKQSYASQTTAQVGALLASFGDELAGLQQEMARTLAITATQLARRIVRSEIGARPELIAQVAQEALDTLLLSAKHITLRVHPDDHALVAQGAAEVLQARGARLLADAAMARGGCLVESDIGIIDASLETRWRRAAAALGIDEAWDAAPAIASAADRDGDPAEAGAPA
jgi:flagellar assembly protein FliH